MATIDQRNEYKFCTIPQDLICGSDYLMPRRNDKKLLVGCDIGFLMEGASERHRLADSRYDNQTSFNRQMDRNILKQRLVDIQSSLYNDATRDVNSIENGRTVGAYIKLPYETVLSAEMPLKDETIQKAYPEYRFTGNELTQAGDITDFLDRRPIQSMFDDLNQLCCCERYSNIEISYPDYTNVTKKKIQQNTKYDDWPTMEIDDKKKYLYESNTLVWVVPYDSPEDVYRYLYWNAIEAKREWYDSNELRFSPFTYTVNVERWNGDLIDKCVGYAQLSVSYNEFKTEPYEYDTSKYVISFSEEKTFGLYYPLVCERTSSNSWKVPNESLQKLVRYVKQKIGYVDKTVSDIFKDGDIARFNIDVYKYRPVYYLTDRTMT